MMHCGYEPATILDAINHPQPRDLLKLAAAGAG